MTSHHRSFLYPTLAFLVGVACLLGENRAWTMNDGRRAVAELAHVEGDYVFLRFGPIERRYELKNFSEEDHEYVRNWFSKARCGACNQPLTTRTKKAGRKSYHLTCFRCVACGKGFRGGDRFQVD